MKTRIYARTTVGLVASCLLSLQAWAEPASTPAQEQTCRDLVAKFEESMAIVRKSVGYERAAEIKEALLPNKIESELFSKSGYCGVARYLQDKKLLDKKKANLLP